MSDVPNRNWNYPTAIKFGVGRIAELADHAQAKGFAKPLFVTDRALSALPITAQALDVLSKGGVSHGVFAEVDANPTETNMAAGIAAYHAGGHDSVIAVPTTAGTGSEVGAAGVLTNSATHVKKIIWHPALMPKVTICDPALTVGMPRFITAGTGMDALAHCLEAYCTPSYHPMASGIALEGMRLVFQNLRRVHDQPGDLMARGHMMSAAAMGAVAFQNGLGAIHALSHPVGALYNTHHGTTNGVVMPMVLAFNRAAVEERIDRMTDMALDDPTAGSNPVKMTRENTRALFDACM